MARRRGSPDTHRRPGRTRPLSPACLALRAYQEAHGLTGEALAERIHRSTGCALWYLSGARPVPPVVEALVSRLALDSAPYVAGAQADRPVQMAEAIAALGSQVAVGRALGVDASIVSRWLHGSNAVPAHIAARLAALMALPRETISAKKTQSPAKNP